MKKTAVLWVVFVALASLVWPCTGQADENGENGRNRVEKEIWALEEAYFTNFYSANYEALLGLVHDQFLGWPGGAPGPIDKDGSSRFMRQMVPKPSLSTFRIERAGIRIIGDTALTQYIIHVNSGEGIGLNRAISSRITHTWVKEGSAWKLLGGMSGDMRE